MNRFDERRPRFWRHGRGRDRDDMFRDEDYRFEAGEESGRTPGDRDQQPYSGNPYGYYPGHGRSRRDWGGDRGGGWGRDAEPGDRERWSSQRYGQREPYNTRGGSGRAPWGRQRNDEDSRYSESQYGMRRGRFEPYGDRYEAQFGEGPFADTSEAPGYFGSGNYGDGGASYTGGFDQRSRTRNRGSLDDDTFGSSGLREPRRYRTGPKGYTRSDERIREDICERLMLADSIDSSEVTVSVKDGRVTLEGTVPVRSMKHGIEDLADYTAGIQDVDNRIRVERPGSEASRSGASSTGVQTASGITPTGSAGTTTKQ